MALALSEGCHRAEIDVDRLVDKGDRSAVVGGAETGPESSQGHGAQGAEVDGDTSSGRGESAGPKDGRDDIAELLCRDPLEPAQEDCLLLEKYDCSEPSGPSWVGCAGACEVCEDLLREFPYYLEWHPCCRAAPCGDSPRVCDERCPPPATRDKVKPCHDD
jgi:hypothetical protein